MNFNDLFFVVLEADGTPKLWINKLHVELIDFQLQSVRLTSGINLNMDAQTFSRFIEWAQRAYYHRVDAI